MENESPLESIPRPIQDLQAPEFTIVAPKDAQATTEAEDGIGDGAAAAVPLVASRCGRRLPYRRGALPGGAGDLAVGTRLGGGAVPDLCRAEQL